MGLVDDSFNETKNCPQCSNHLLHACTSAVNILLLLWGAATTRDKTLVLVCQLLGAFTLYLLIKRITLMMR